MSESMQKIKAQQAPGYGEQLCDKIRSETEDYSKLDDFSKFVLNHGYQYDTKEQLQAAYDRAWKAGHGILLTEEEFNAALCRNGNQYSSALYGVLRDLVEKKIMKPGEVYAYAFYHWCANAPEAVIAFQTGRSEWTVNNCDAAITVEQALDEVNQEWGFQKDKIQIIGQPYYEATDWQFIRFNAPHMGWLWANGSIYQVYE